MYTLKNKSSCVCWREREGTLYEYELLPQAIFRSLLPRRRIEVRSKQEICRDNLIETIIKNVIVKKNERRWKRKRLSKKDISMTTNDQMNGQLNERPLWDLCRDIEEVDKWVVHWNITIWLIEIEFHSNFLALINFSS